jgi:pyridoxal 5'-phosphate synthase pdxT subunit
VTKKKVGVLALQGDFAAHRAALERAGADAVLVRESEQLADLDGLVLPGGESTTMLKLLHQDGLLDAVTEFGRKKPLFGTCAGAILMAREVSSPAQESLHLMDIGVQRNAYGRQINSRVTELAPHPDFERRTAPGKLEAVFIRAPIIRRVGEGCKVLATYQGDPVLVEQDKRLVSTFHPELTGDLRVHELFLEKL